MSEDRKTMHMFNGALRRVMSNTAGEIRCLGCMETYPEKYEICPMCGYVEGTEVENALHIYPGTVLNDKYIVGKVLGHGGFGVTYLAWDTVLQIKVAIKEYLPSEFSTRSAGQTRVTVFSGEKSIQFTDGKEKFIEEAKRLAVFRGEPGIVEIYDTFEENETAYLVMEYLDGETLKQKLERDGKIEADKAIEMLMPIMSSLDKVHEEGIIHRDIAPDNIFLTNNGEAKLIDFGASRYATTTKSRSLTVIIKQGYSAEEQYRSKGDQGPHTDIYSLGAVLYKMITGITPPDAMERKAQYEKNKKDMLVPISKITKNISKNQETAIYNAMNVRIEDRTGEIITFAGELQSAESVKRRKIGIKKQDSLTWPLWAKIGLPVGIVVIVMLTVLLSMGIIGPQSTLQKDYIVPDGQALVPDVIGKSVENAEMLLSENSLIYTIKDKVESGIPKETVMLQAPDAFNITDMGSAIELILSEGKGSEYVVDVTGKPIEEARVILEELGFKVKTAEEISKEVAPGSVIAQSISADEEVEKGTEITLVVSIGSEDIDTSEIVKVPDLIGKSYEEAIAELTKINLYYSKEEVYNASLPEKQVIGMNPSAGEDVNAGTTIKITVNMGSKTVVLKNYSYRSLESVQEELEAQGLKVSVKYEENKIVAAGTIIRNQPASGTTVKTGSTVVLTVSNGFTVTVPDVKGMSLEAAQEKLTANGLASNITRYEASETVGEGKVISQGVAANTKVKQGTLVGLVISSGPTEKEDEPAAVLLTSLTISSKPIKSIYYVGDSFEQFGLKVTAKYSDGTTKNVTNLVSIKSPDLSTSGTKTVTVSYEDKTASFTITVNSIRILLTSTSLGIKVGETGKLIATTTPAGCAVTWSSSNTNVATVSDGTVTGKASGNATITATIKRGSETKSATCSVSVTTKTPSFDLLPVTLPDLNLKVGEVADARSVAQRYIPVDISRMDITWISSDTSVVTVSSDGQMTAIAPGSAKITSTTYVDIFGMNTKVTVDGTVNVSQSVTQPSGFAVTFDANGGYVSQKSKTVTTGASYGSLPTPTRNGFAFVGWFKADGTQVTDKTIFNDAKNITLKARWKSDWVLAYNAPAGSQIAEQKWTYTSTKTTSSSSSMMAGWTFTHKENGYGKEIGPVYSDPTNGTRKVRPEQYVSSETIHYKYYHRYGWGHNISTGTNGYVWGSDSQLGSGARHEIDLTYQLTRSGNFAGNPNYKSYKCPHGCGTSTIWLSDGQYSSPNYSTRWYYQEPAYTYYFKKVEDLESTKEVKASDAGANETISNIKKWVKYIVK